MDKCQRGPGENHGALNYCGHAGRCYKDIRHLKFRACKMAQLYKVLAPGRHRQDPRGKQTSQTSGISEQETSSQGVKRTVTKEDT